MGVYRLGLRRFLPNRRESMDQAPGPSSAREALIAANRIAAQKLPLPENAAQSSEITRAPPAMGVHKPMHSSSAARPEITVRNKEGAEVICTPSTAKTAIAAINRRPKSPIPGPPRAKLEYSRCKRTFPLQSYAGRPGSRNPNHGNGSSLFRVICPRGGTPLCEPLLREVR